MNMKKTLIVVGAGKGLGNAIAREFARHQFRVVLIARNIAHLSQYKAEFEADGIETYTKVADASKPETLTAALHEIEQELGTPDCLVYNVGVTEPDGDKELTNSLLMQRYQIDCASAWHCANLISTKDFGAKNGCIIFTGGGFAKTFNPVPGISVLSVDKAALNAMNIVLHKLLEPKGIFVGSVIVKGIINPETEHNAANIAKHYWKMYEDRCEYEVVV